MLHTVKTLEQTKASTLLLTHSPETPGQTYTLEDLISISQKLHAKYFRVSTRKEGINIVLGIEKKKAFFGRAASFQDAFRTLLEHLSRNGITITFPEELASA
ncbi:hypothetical protein MPN29_02580 [Riemerella anatipestifer]|uniref:hypothetical protein n=1 Tax=Riemerella anatipestifer TaxID=34085 RepID=UPI0007ED795C|nr:hypothetical protein [Riemerella anatipestifer]MDD1549106.1 hypothetical protein [Riemerella anatipestifer]MDR7831928.1 hypothetical protein [Riemerella anatipestifer]OBP62819.1 hypothetical protein AWB84_06850 [Riemerella anatipestifer]QZO83726.1 hypothetical protein K6T40_02575 [Riemerella anatipestifer]WKV54604.1 hypothetical protein MPN29_02580 [Riemerella anatipestifer]